MSKVEKLCPAVIKMAGTFHEKCFITQLYLCAIVFLTFYSKNVKKFEDMSPAVKYSLAEIIKSWLDKLKSLIEAKSAMHLTLMTELR